MKTLLALVVALALFAGTASAQTPCVKNLGTLAERQFDNAYVSLINKVDHELKRTGHYIYRADGSVLAYEATSSIDVTKIHRGVVDYTACILNHLPVPTTVQQSGTKLFLVSRIYNLF